jgi:hypothetical protein
MVGSFEHDNGISGDKIRRNSFISEKPQILSVRTPLHGISHTAVTNRKFVTQQTSALYDVFCKHKDTLPIKCKVVRIQYKGLPLYWKVIMHVRDPFLVKLCNGKSNYEIYTKTEVCIAKRILSRLCSLLRHKKFRSSYKVL